MKSAMIKILGVATFAIGFAAPSFANFSGAYALPWTTTTGAGGSGGTTVDTSGSPDSLTFLGGAEVCDKEDCPVFYSVNVPSAGNITFAWAYSTDDEPFFERFGYAVNGFNTMLTNNADSPLNGTKSVPVLGGDVFAFWYDCTDCEFEPGQASIRDFNGPGGNGAVPEPATLALLGMGLLGLGASRLRAGRR